MADIAAVVIQTLQWVGAPVTRQFQYLCCFTRNITSLEDEANQLEGATQDLQGKVDRAKNDLRVISRRVEIWLQNSNDIQNKTRGILYEASNVESGCSKLGARFFLSRRAKKTADRVKELRGQCNFDDDAIAQPAPAAARQPIPSGITYEIFESRKQIEEDIMAALRGEGVKMMGICGMGGLGKTTMAKKIMNRARGDNLFREIVITVIGQEVDELRIQLEIGRALGLNLTKEEAPQARVQKLNARLRGTKRILLVLDDVWESLVLVLENIGIPSDYKECTILLTSRNDDVLKAMDVQKIFGMKELSKEDSWIMFRDRVGIREDNTELNSLARKVANKCKGLPLALTTVGAALKGEVNVNAWKNAVGQLEKGDPDIQGYSKNVYNPLKLSYDVLDPKYKDVFLLCCVYPEDADIPLEQLTYFCMGLCIATGSVEEARNRIRALTKVLKSRSLLLDSEKGDEYVRMHDVVRDVCMFIAKQEGYIGDNDLTSSLKRYKHHSRFKLLQIRNSADEEINFDGISDLYVLSIERYSQLTSLPFTQRPNNLITLVLDDCWGLKTLSVVGELVNLEILICRNCDLIEELPPEIKRLNRLKVLDLTKCRKLKRIGRGIISSLVGLEELKMLESFKKWEGEDREEGENAGLIELEALINLRCLEIEIMDFKLVAEKIVLSSKVDRFTIGFAGGSFPSISDKYLPKRKMSLELQETTSFEHWKPFLRETVCLILSGNGANKVCLPELEKIRYLELRRCESMKNVVTSMDDGAGAIVFPVSLNCFQILKELKLSFLPALKQLWKSSQNDLGKDFLPQLEVLEIEYCEMMEAVFLWEGDSGNENNSSHHIFPKLKELMLVHLPNLISLCQGIEGIEFPLLRKFFISTCRKMKGMVSNGMGSNENNSGGSSSNAGIHGLFCPQQVSFGCLKKLHLYDIRNPFCSHTIDVSLLNGLEELTIFKCAGSLSLFTSSMAENLVNLKELRISECEEMVEVIKDDEEKGMSGGRQRTLLFPKLQELWLESLPELVSFCEWKCDIEFPSLSLFYGNGGIEFPLLRKIGIYGCKKMKGMVANGMSKENNSGGLNNNAADTSESQQLYVLPKLVSFCGLKCDVEFPSLRQVTTYNCPNMKNFTLGSLAAPNLKSFNIDLKDDLLQVPFISPKQLSVFRNEKPLNCYQIHGSVFDRLEVLNIDGYEGSMSLFSSSITGNLVNLTTLTISSCDKMVKVIEEKEEEKEKVVSGAQRTTILFPKLQQLVLFDLPELVRFCEWKCDVELPSLTEVEIKWCRNMKSCTAGLLTTPNLKSVEIEDEEFGEVKDLNGLVQQQYLRRAEEEEEEEEDDDDDDDDDVDDENREEQN